MVIYWIFERPYSESQSKNQSRGILNESTVVLHFFILLILETSRSLVLECLRSVPHDAIEAILPSLLREMMFQSMTREYSWDKSALALLRFVEIFSVKMTKVV